MDEPPALPDDAAFDMPALVRRLAAHAFLSFVATLAWAPAVTFYGILTIIGYLMFKTASPNPLLDWLHRCGDLPSVQSLLAWLGMPDPVTDVNMLEAAPQLITRSLLLLYLINLPLQYLPERFQPGMRAKSLFVVVLTVVLIAMFTYLTRYLKISKGTPLELAAVMAFFFLVAMALSIAALAITELLLRAIARRLDPGPAEQGQAANV